MKDINRKLGLSLLNSHGPLRMRGSACWWFSQIKATQGHRHHASMPTDNWNVQAIKNHWHFHGKRVAMHSLSHRPKWVLISGIIGICAMASKPQHGSLARLSLIASFYLWMKFLLQGHYFLQVPSGLPGPSRSLTGWLFFNPMHGLIEVGRFPHASVTSS